MYSHLLISYIQHQGSLITRFIATYYTVPYCILHIAVTSSVLLIY